METKTMNLVEIETELEQLVSSDKSSWVRIYELMEMVDREELYKGTHRSFTAWVNEFAIKSKVHVSLLWSRRKAGKMYADYQERAAKQGRSVPDIKDVEVSPDNFVLIEKIAGSNSAVADDLTDKVLAGNLGRSDLKNAWATVRQEKKNVRVNAHDKQKEQPAEPPAAAESKEKPAAPAAPSITAADIVLALSRSSWIPNPIPKAYQQDRYKVMTEFAVNTGTSHHVRRIDALVVENLTPTERSKVALHGIEIKVSKSDLLKDSKMQEYTDFVDFFWLAVPEAILEEAKGVIAKGWGILCIDAKGRVKVVAQAHQGKPVFRDKTLEMVVLKLI